MTARVSDERLLELLLEHGAEAGAELARLRAEPETAVRIDGLEAWLGSARAALDEPALAPASEEALVERVLAATTREDLSWRGDLRLIGGFVRQRLRESALVRVVAASLLVHLLVVPAAAWMLLRDEPDEPHLYIQFEAREEPLSEGVEEEAPGPEIPALDLDEDYRAAWTARNRLARARFLLTRPGLPAPAGTGDALADAALEIRLLDARSRFLHGEPWPLWLDELDTRELHGPSGGAALALLAELALDRFARDGERSSGFHAILGGLASHLGESSGGGRPESVDRLLRAALDRAAGYGLGTTGVPADGRPAPVDAAWCELLANALGAELAAHPIASAWIAAGR
ncbi:MAG: hypothetical protein AAF682_23945 [Planctomycetota bacterium]